MNEMDSNRKERVLIDESVIDIYRQLRAEGDTQPELSPFRSNKDVFMLATCLGFQAGRRSKLPSGGKSDIRQSVFNENDLAILKAIAIANTGDVHVLSNTGDVLRIAEEYAHSGIYDLKVYLLEQRGQPLINLIELIRNTDFLN